MNHAMTYAIIWDKKAIVFLKKIDRKDAQRIIRKINDVADDPEHFLEPLAGISGYKLRIGDYRAIISLNKPGGTMAVLLIGHRKNIYDRMD